MGAGVNTVDTGGSRFEFALVSTLVQEAAAVTRGWVPVPPAFAQALSAPEMSVVCQHLESIGMKKPRMCMNSDFQLILQWDRAFKIPAPASAN